MITRVEELYGMDNGMFNREMAEILGYRCEYDTTAKYAVFYRGEHCVGSCVLCATEDEAWTDAQYPDLECGNKTIIPLFASDINAVWNLRDDSLSFEIFQSSDKTEGHVHWYDEEMHTSGGFTEESSHPARALATALAAYILTKKQRNET